MPNSSPLPAILSHLKGQGNGDAWVKFTVENLGSLKVLQNRKGPSTWRRHSQILNTEIAVEKDWLFY